MIVVALQIEQDVARLDVAVHEAVLVGRVERLGELAGDLVARSGSAARLQQQRLQVDAVDEAHGDEQAPVDLARFVDRDDVGMVQARRQPRLSQQPLAKALVLREALGQDLQRDGASQRVSRAR